MQGPILKVSRPQNVCFFCNLRRSFNTTRVRRPTIQKRSLHTSQPTSRPSPATFAFGERADRDEEGHLESVSISRPRQTPRFGGGWKGGLSTVELTPEEVRQRNALSKQEVVQEREDSLNKDSLKKDYPKKESLTSTRNWRDRHSIPQSNRHVLPNIRAVFDSSGLSDSVPLRKTSLFSNREQHEALRKASETDNIQPSRPRFKISRIIQQDKVNEQQNGWSCWKCEHRNSRNDRNCARCNAVPLDTYSKPRTPDPRSRDAVPHQQWQHLRKKDRAEEGVHVRAATPRLEDSEMLVQDMQLPQEQRHREIKNGSDRFVGLRSGNQVPRTSNSMRSQESYLAESGADYDYDRSISTSTPQNSGTIRWTPSTVPRSEPPIDSTSSSKELQDSALPQASLPQVAEHHQLTMPEDTSYRIARADPGAEENSAAASRSRRRAEKFETEELPRMHSVRYESRSYERRERSSRAKGRNIAKDDDEDMEEQAVNRAERKRQRKKDKIAQRAAAPPTRILLPEFISVGNLAAALRIKIEDFTNRLSSLGFAETSNDHVVDGETAGLIATEFNFEPIIIRSESQDLQPAPPAVDKSLLNPRPPIVTIMGHVDHGKTTLLDYLRKSSVAASEFGGITQHIGAFSVPMPSGRLITFLDTPGHAAFLAMRARGATVTDIIILVVAADDGVKPQTIEAIKHAQTAKVPMIVAVNKIDKEGSDLDRVKKDLARNGVEIEDYGGDTQVVPVSGKTGQGVPELEDAVVALADVLDMRAETDGVVEGWVVEATTKKAGRVATVLVRRGTLEPGSFIIAGTSWARVRTLRNEAGSVVASAGPGTPVEVDGWREMPSAGDEVLQAEDKAQAKDVVQLREEREERVRMAADVAAVNEARRTEAEKREQEERELGDARKKNTLAGAGMVGREENTGIKEVYLIIRADVSGSVEAVLNNISALGNAEVRPHILRSAVGPVTESDIEYAAAASGHIISFNVRTDPEIARFADTKGVRVLEQNIIYRLVDDVKAVLEEQLGTTTTQKVVGEAEVAQVYQINVKGGTMPIAGCRVRNGVMSRSKKVRILRRGEVVHDGTLSSLKNVKKNVTEMRKGTECGMGFEDWTGWQVGDQIQCYEETVVKRTL